MNVSMFFFLDSGLLGTVMIKKNLRTVIRFFNNIRADFFLQEHDFY